MRRALLIAVLAAAGCGGGAQSPLRFGADFSKQSLAVGAKQRFQLQLPSGFLYSNADGALVMHEEATGIEVPLTKTGFGQFETVLTRAGRYTLDGSSGTEYDSVTVKAEEISELALRDQLVYTTVGNTTCSAKPLAGLVMLAPNQRLAVNVVSVNADGAPMTGIYDFEVLDLGTYVNRPFILGGPNEFSITAAGDGSVTFTERKTGKSVRQDIARATADAACPSISTPLAGLRLRVRGIWK